jgi:peptide/nickel transport system substrate-binding protein
VSPELTDWYDESQADLPPFDPERARTLLDDAGYPDGFELTMPTLPLLQVNNEAIAQMLRDVGIRVELVPLQPGQLGPEMRKGSFAAAFTTTTEYHPQQFLGIYASSAGPFDPFGVDDTEPVDEALAAAAGADQPTAKQRYSEAQREAIDAGILLPVAFAPIVNFAAAEVEGAFLPLGARNAPPFGLRLADS